MTGIAALLAAALAAGSAADAPRRTVSLSGPGWICDGEEVCVPHTWNATDGADGARGAGRPGKPGASIGADTYLRKAARYSRRLPDPVPGRRQFVRFGGASLVADVFVNGRKAGSHAGAYTAFTVEATPFLKPESNVLEVVVDNRLNSRVAPLSGDYTLFGGLYRDVEWIETPQVCIDPVTDGADGIAVETTMDGNVSVFVKVLGGEDEIQKFKIDDPVPWTPETPRIYKRTIRIASGDEVEASFGFRTVEFREDGFYLNGVRRVLRGVNRHQDCGCEGWAASKADEERDFSLIKEIGADAVRLAHYPQSRNVYDICDREGLLVWSELPATNRLGEDPGFKENLLAQAREMIAQTRNHPCVFTWSVFNEIYNDDPQKKLREGWMEKILEDVRDEIKRLDPSRPVSAASCYPLRKAVNAIPEALGFNAYPLWYGDTTMDGDIAKWFEATGRTTLGISEYGAGADPAAHVAKTPCRRLPAGGRFHPEEAQTRVLSSDWKAIKSDPRIWGSFVWAMFDFAADARREGAGDGVNDKGLVTRDRNVKKDAFWFFKANWSKEKTLHVCSRRMEWTDAEEIDVVGFSNAGETELCVNGKRIGAAAPDGECVVRWDSVRLEAGVNEIVLRAGGLEASRRVVRGKWTATVVEAESLRSTGGWTVDPQFTGTMGSPYLLAHGLGRPVADAEGEFDSPEEGVHSVWVRTANWTAPWTDGKGGAGVFRLAVNGVETGVDLGVEEGCGWRWTRAGSARLAKGKNTLALRDMDGFDARCDAIAFARGETSPERLVAARRAIVRETVDEGEFDLVVAGGGIAGTCAAITAAKLGAKRVALVQDRLVLGGNNSSEVRVHLGGRQNLGPYPNLGEIVSLIGPARGGNAEKAENYEDGRKTAEAGKHPNLELFLGTKIDKVEKKDGRIAAVSGFDTRSGARRRFRGKFFLDATGDGTVGALAGADFRIGREAKSETGESSAPEKADMMTMGSSIQWRADDAEDDSFPARHWMIPFTDENATAALKGDWDWETGMGRDPIAEAERIRDYGMLVAYSNWAHVKNSPATKERFKGKNLVWTASVAGRRESRRLLGDVVLTENDIDGERYWPDATCLTSWSVDLHFPKTAEETKFDGEPFKAATVHKKIKSCPIPFRALYSRNVPNLLMAGRDISVTHAALGTVRVMRTAGMTGEVAGRAAVFCCENGILPRDIHPGRWDEFSRLLARPLADVSGEPPQNYNEGFTLGVSEKALAAPADRRRPGGAGR